MRNGKFSLKELRARKEKTQAQVAAAIGVSTQTYNAWEKDASNVSIANIQRLAKYFGCELDEIFFKHRLENNSSDCVEQ